MASRVRRKCGQRDMEESAVDGWSPGEVVQILMEDRHQWEEECRRCDEEMRQQEEQLMCAFLEMMQVNRKRGELLTPWPIVRKEIDQKHTNSVTKH